jgi:hypothetical protein
LTAADRAAGEAQYQTNILGIPRLGLGIHELTSSQPHHGMSKRWKRPRALQQTRGWQGQALP